MRGNSQSAAQRRPRRKTVFLEALADTVNVTLACQRAGIPRRTAYDWRHSDQAFAAKWDDALDVGIDLLEAELHTRAFDGVERPVYYKGEQVGTWRYYSDALAMFLLKAHRPERYREGYVAPEVMVAPAEGEITPEIRKRVIGDRYQSIMDHNGEARRRYPHLNPEAATQRYNADLEAEEAARAADGAEGEAHEAECEEHKPDTG